MSIKRMHFTRDNVSIAGLPVYIPPRYHRGTGKTATAAAATGTLRQAGASPGARRQGVAEDHLSLNFAGQTMDYQELNTARASKCTRTPAPPGPADAVPKIETRGA